MCRQAAGLIVVYLCAISSLAAQTLQFGTRQDIQTNATHLTGLVVADFNGDKKLDIAVTDDYSQVVSVYLNDGTGKFGTPVTSTFTVPSIGGFGALVVGDVNEDGKQDLFVGPIAGLQYDVVLLGNGDGTFTEKGQIATTYGFENAALVDINGDKHLDLIAGGNGSLFVNLGDGQGNFTQQPLPNYLGGDLYTGVTVGDFNGDKLLDFVAASYRDNRLLYFSGNGDGTFQPSSDLTVQHTTFPLSLASADFNGDGKLDLLAGFNQVAALIPGNGDGTFQTGAIVTLPLPAAINFAATGISPFVAAADMNGDGKVDAVAADNASDTLDVFLNDGTGKFSSSFSAALDSGTGALQVADLNGDGLPDVVVINYETEKISFFLSVPAKVLPTVSIQSSAAQALVGSPVTITVQVNSLASHPPTGTVTLASGTTSYGQQTLNSNGQANFTLPALGVGQYPLIASYEGDAYNGASNTPAFTQSITDFQLSLSSSAQTVAIGAAATYSLTLTPLAGFVGPVTFSCAGLPAGYTCSAQTVSVNAQAADAAVVVSPPTTAAQSPFGPFLLHSGTATFFAFSVICFRSRRRRIGQLLLCIAALAAFGAATGCSGGNSGSQPSGYTGTSNFTITASASKGSITVSHQVSATLTVQ